MKIWDSVYIFNGTHDIIRCPSSFPLKNREGWDSPNSIFTDFSLVVLFQSKINLNFVESVPKLQCWKYLLIFSGSFSSSHFYERSTSKVDKRKQDAISKVDKKRQDIDKTLNRRKKSSEHFSDENDSQHSRYISNFYTRHYSGDLNPKLVRYLNGQKEVGCQMVWYSNALWIPDSWTIWISGKWMPSCFPMYWCSIQMVGQVHST